MDVEQIKVEFYLFKTKEKVQYCMLEKCKLKTTSGKKGKTEKSDVFSSMTEIVDEYIKDLEQREFIIRSESVGRILCKLFKTHLVL